MENPWNTLTTRHKRYCAMAVIFGVLAGALTGLLLAAFIGFGFTLFGIVVYTAKWNKEDKLYNTFMAVAIGAIFLGSFCFVGAIIGLYLHQIGYLVILLYPLATPIQFPIDPSKIQNLSIKRIIKEYSRLRKAKKMEDKMDIQAMMTVDLALHQNEMCNEINNRNKNNNMTFSFIFIILGTLGFVAWYILTHVKLV